MPGDVLIGLPSAGLHTNGYSLARRVLFEIAGWQADTFVAGARHDGRRRAAGAAPLVSARRAAAARARLGEGLAHITGGGITENLPRVLPEGCARGDRSPRRGTCRRCSGCCRSAGRLPREEMFRAFNMGIGLVIVLRRPRRRARDQYAGAGRRAARGPDWVRRLTDR